MENTQIYIESGILELYALGDLTDGERLEVETMVQKYPEVAAELEKVEHSIFVMAENYSIEPAEHIRESFLSKLTFDDDDEIESQPIENLTSTGQAKVVTIKPSNFYKYRFAASFALLVISLGAIFYLYNNLQQSQQQIATLQSSNQSFANKVNYLDNQVKLAQNSISLYANPDIKVVKLAGTANSPSSKMMVMWNVKEQKVMIDMQSMALPLNDADHQYQLWALVDGKPVDLGVFDVNGELTGMQVMKNIGAAQTFAVTLEPQGGSLNPTMSQLMLMGNI